MRDEWISVCGKKTVVIEKLREVGFSDQVSEKLIDFLTKEKNILCEDELYRMEQIYPNARIYDHGLQLLSKHKSWNSISIIPIC